MNATSAVISDGVLWATTPLFAAAHLWSWHPLWAAGIWTAYGISALLPQGEALLSKMADSPVQHNFNPLQSRICGLKYGSVIIEVPTNNSKDRMTSVLVTSTVSTSDPNYTARAGEHDRFTSVVTVDATKINDQSTPVSTSQWRAPGDPNNLNLPSASGNPSSSGSLIREVSPQFPSSLPVSSKDRAFKSSSYTPSFSPVSSTTHLSTGLGLGAYGGPTPVVLDELSNPPEFGGLRHFKPGLLQRVGDYEIWGRRVRDSWPVPFLVWAIAFAVWQVYELLRQAYRRIVGAPPPATAAPAASVPAPNAVVLYVPQPNTPADCYATIRQHVQQWAQGFIYYWQTFKDALTGWAANPVWNNNYRSHLRVARVVAILVFCMYIFMQILSAFLEGAWMRKTVGGTATSPSVTISECLWQLKLCTSSAIQTPLSETGSYGPFPAPSSRTEFVCERTLRVVMSYKAVGLAMSQTIFGDLKHCFDAARTNPMSPSGVYYPTPYFGRTASLCAAIERAVVGARALKRSHMPHNGLFSSVWFTVNLVYQVLMSVFLSIVMTLDFFAVFHVRRYFLHACFIALLTAQLWTYLREISEFQSKLNGVSVIATTMHVFHDRKRLVPRWVGVLQRLKITSRNTRPAPARNPQRGATDGVAGAGS